MVYRNGDRYEGSFQDGFRDGEAPIVGQMVTSTLVGLSGISRMVRVLLNGAMVGSIKAIL